MTRQLCAAALGAVAVVGLTACGSDGLNPGAAPVTPSASPRDEAVGGDGITVAPTTFQLRYRLDGVLVASNEVRPEVPAGMTLSPTVKEGDRVAVGDVLGTLKVTDADSEVGGTVEKSRRLLQAGATGPVRAPVAGVVRLGSSGLSIRGEGIDVVVPLRPLQELRYRGMQFSATATVETVLGQRTVPCQALWIERVASTGSVADQADTGPSASAAVHCRLSRNVETAPGLPAVAQLTSGALDSVFAVPVAYVGMSEDGKDYIVKVGDGAEASERPVVVGPTDGVRRVILEGLRDGETVLPMEGA